MASFGFALLVAAFAAALVSVAGLAVGSFAKSAKAAGSAKVAGSEGPAGLETAAGSAKAASVTVAATRTADLIAARIGRIGALAVFLALLACCALLVGCFMTGDVSILYVLEQRSLSTDGLAWLYKLSGLWAGRSGSLLFWTFLIALFGALILLRARRERAAGADSPRRLDDLALMIVSAVVAVFCGVLLFSEGNMPFEPTPASYFTEDGTLTAAASHNSMNQLLEHWAMAIHPPLLFAGYAGLTIPFAYAMATLVANDASRRWVDRCQRFVLVSWLFLGAGIGLGAVWAYVVLGWGGYWGWDPVENASLLSWLVCVALVHTFTVYRQRGAFKRWAIMCACLAFTFVIVATFITRSGIVDSVHAFAGDPVSLALFGGLIVVSLVVSVAGIISRWKSFGPDTEGGDDVENMLSKDAAYYFNNVIMMLFALLLTYMTLTSSLPGWMPFGGDSLGTTSYEAIARPLGIVYLLILAVCPLLAWGKTDPKKFMRQARVPALCGLAVFALLAVWWATQLTPIYDAMMAKQNANSETLLEAGPAWYYNGLALFGLLVASLLLFNAAFMFVRNIRAPRRRGAAIGGAFAHVAMAVILVGLVGSNMYVYEETGYLSAEGDATFAAAEYELVPAGDSIDDRTDDNGTVLYQVDFDVYKDGALIGQAHPSVQLDTMTQQQKLNASVLSFPEEDLFVVYRGVNADGAYSLDVRVNSLIGFVWVGFAMLMLGTLCAAVMPRRSGRAGAGEGSAQQFDSSDELEGGEDLRSLHSASSDADPTGIRIEEGGAK